MENQLPRRCGRIRSYSPECTKPAFTWSTWASSPGTEEGLKTLHKQITVEQNIRSSRVLKEIRPQIFEFGFMLLEPSSTFESVAENVRFLRSIAGDGWTGVTFGRMVPYDGTPSRTIWSGRGD